MAAAIPTNEPAQLTAGDTATWKKSLADYSAADGWTLSYSLRGNDNTIDFDAGASGSDFLVSVAAATTANWFAGQYSAIGFVSKAGERFTVWRGSFEVLPNLAAETSEFDPRSKAKKILDFIEASFEKVAAKQSVSSSVAGVSLNFRSMDELTRARDYWLSVYNAEQSKLTGQNNRIILARFVNP